MVHVDYLLDSDIQIDLSFKRYCDKASGLSGNISTNFGGAKA